MYFFKLRSNTIKSNVIIFYVSLLLTIQPFDNISYKQYNRYIILPTCNYFCTYNFKYVMQF